MGTTQNGNFCTELPGYRDTREKAGKIPSLFRSGNMSPYRAICVLLILAATAPVASRADDDYYHDDDDDYYDGSASAPPAPGGGDPESLHRAAIALVEAGDTQGALAKFIRAAHLQPCSSMRWNNVGVTYMRLNRKGDAIDTFKRALALNADDPTAADNLELTWQIPARHRKNGIFCTCTSVPLPSDEWVGFCRGLDPSTLAASGIIIVPSTFFCPACMLIWAHIYSPRFPRNVPAVRTSGPSVPSRGRRCRHGWRCRIR